MKLRTGAAAGFVAGMTTRLPSWVIWQERPFPDANLLMLVGRESALVDSGFVGHAQATLSWAEEHAASGRVALVVNTHWHSDHVGGNALLQSRGAGVAAAAVDADALGRRDETCCLAEYLDQPVAPYAVDEVVADGQVIRLGEADWQVIATPGHTPGHVCLWQPEERLLVTGDALTDYDVGWVNLALDGPGMAATALASLERLADLKPRALLTAHGPMPSDPEAAFANALRRARRLVDDPGGAVWYGARRVFAFALMIHGGVPAAEVEPYLNARDWLVDAAGLLGLSTEDAAAQLVSEMLRGGSVVMRDGRLRAAAPHSPVDPATIAVPFPCDWPPAG